MNRQQEHIMQSAIVTIAKLLPSYANLTIFPYDEMTDYVFVESAGIKVDDVRVRLKEPLLPLKVNGNGADFDEQLIDKLVHQVERLADEVEEYNEHKNEEWRKQRKHASTNKRFT